MQAYGCGLWLKFLLDVSPPSVCSIFRTGLSSSQMDSQWGSFVPLEHSVFHPVMGEGSWTPISQMPSLNSGLFLLTAGLLLLLGLFSYRALICGPSGWSDCVLCSWILPHLCCWWCWLVCIDVYYRLNEFCSSTKDSEILTIPFAILTESHFECLFFCINTSINFYCPSSFIHPFLSWWFQNWKCLWYWNI